MSVSKVFDSASLLTIFDNADAPESAIGSFHNIARDGGLPPREKRVTHTITAWTRAYWCEKLRLSIVEQGVAISEFGADWLSSGHPYRSTDLPRLKMLRTVWNSATLMRQIMQLADAWRAEMAEHLPSPFDDALLDHSADEIQARVPGIESVTVRRS